MQNEKFNMLNEDQRFVNKVLDKYGLEIKWLSQKIKMDAALLRYQLREAINYRQDVHTKIVEALTSAGYISSNKEICDNLKDELIDFSAVLTGTVSLISKSVKRKIKDHHLSEDEKVELKKDVKSRLNSVTDIFNDLLITIDLA